MSQSVRPAQNCVGTDDDAQPETSERTALIDVATTNLSLESYETFRVVSKLTEDTIERAQP